jgi:hypothetical protein
MPHAPISCPDFGGVTLAALGDGTVYLPKRRLCAWVYLGSETAMRRAVIDTGAPACTLPQKVWRALGDKKIDWLTESPARLAEGPRKGEPAYNTIAGGRYTYRLGHVRLRFDSSPLEVRDLLAICLDDPPRPPDQEPIPILLGLAGLLHGRSLLLQASVGGDRWVGVVSEP